MDIQLFATDEELQDFPENKTDSTVPDKTSNSNSINLMASDLPKSHTLTCLKFPLDYLNVNLNVNPEESTNVNPDPILTTLLWIGNQHWLNNTVHRQADMSKYVVDRQAAQAKKSYCTSAVRTA